MAFFEQIGKHLSDAGQNVAQQTKKLADVTQLNSTISEKQKKISQLYLAIGRSYYERHKTEENPQEEAEKIAEINAIAAEIAEAREKIKRLKGVIKCEKCGAEIPADAAFCNVCGNKINSADAAETELQQERICPVCHEKVDKGNFYCKHCGAKVDTTI